MGQWEKGERIAWLDDSWLDDEIQEPKIEEVVQDIVEDDIEVLRREAEEMIAIEQARMKQKKEREFEHVLAERKIKINQDA